MCEVVCDVIAGAPESDN